MDASDLYLAQFTLRTMRYMDDEPTYESSMCIVQATSEEEAMQKVDAKFTVDEPYDRHVSVINIVLTAAIV